MQVNVEKVDKKEDEVAVIKATEITNDIKAAVELLEGASLGVAVIKDGATYICKQNLIYYIESVDKRTYVYTKDNCYETKYRLYELEEMLGTYFIRCSNP